MLYEEGKYLINGIEVEVGFCFEGWSATFDNKRGKLVGSYGDLQAYSIEELTKLVKTLY